MKTNEDMLSHILKTTQMGQSGIRCVMDYAQNDELRNALKASLQEYDEIEKEALNIAGKHNYNVNELAPVTKKMASMMSKMKLQYGDAQSKIADMMILGNTRGIIKGIRNQHQWEQRDDSVDALTQRLLEYENDNINEMKKFL